MGSRPGLRSTKNTTNRKRWKNQRNTEEHRQEHEEHGLTGGNRTDELATSRREKHRLNYTETH